MISTFIKLNQFQNFRTKTDQFQLQTRESSDLSLPINTVSKAKLYSTQIFQGITFHKATIPSQEVSQTLKPLSSVPNLSNKFLKFTCHLSIQSNVSFLHSLSPRKLLLKRKRKQNLKSKDLHSQLQRRKMLVKAQTQSSKKPYHGTITKIYLKSYQLVLWLLANTKNRHKYLKT